MINPNDWFQFCNHASAAFFIADVNRDGIDDAICTDRDEEFRKYDLTKYDTVPTKILQYNNDFGRRATVRCCA